MICLFYEIRLGLGVPKTYTSGIGTRLCENNGNDLQCVLVWVLGVLSENVRL